MKMVDMLKHKPAYKIRVLAIQRLKALRQTSTVSRHNTSFLAEAHYTGWNETALVEQFKDGLKPDILRAVVMPQGGLLPDTVSAFAAVAGHIDTQLQALPSSKPRTSNPFSSSSRSSSSHTTKPASQPPQFPGLPPRKHEVWVTINGKRRQLPKEKVYCATHGLCECKRLASYPS
ncbi:hypothetical protein L202_02294 [Cryptococcus amylolentus CBS 6039]|uniref:Uncharacterized protein n=1 Tax=Cryptococcus amylolentus CBS 6039 TaxID=1295533 RepID=A0A1E3I0D9_9TREE|nr:hypothetical protein L202_02294 [Cryptococcus amylolentus CBS 6039]ODN81958.1 hypothetical protein L202_02294 [Cryptococcus amylolentus CBS 6039]